MSILAHRSPLRRLPVVATLLALLLMAGPVSAQETETYESEFFPFTVTYNGEVWGSRSTSSFNDNEQLQLTARGTVFFLQAFPADGDDAEDCIANAVRSVERSDNVENVEENDELPVPDGPRGGEEALLTYELTLQGRENPVTFVQYVSCVELDRDSLLLVGVETRAGIYEEELEIIDGILAGVEIES
jgi:hypothetical protein